ncbi:hypothetical protein RCH10_005094 [Variovorax sp. GrIS 2.14]
MRGLCDAGVTRSQRPLVAQAACTPAPSHPSARPLRVLAAHLLRPARSCFDCATGSVLAVGIAPAQAKGEYVCITSVNLRTYTASVGRTVSIAATASGTAAPVQF